MRRNRFDCICDVLQCLEYTPLIATHIMYRANINCSIVKTYIDLLVMKGYINKHYPTKVKNHSNSSRSHYSMTEKGKKALITIKAYRKIQEELTVIKTEKLKNEI